MSDSRPSPVEAECSRHSPPATAPAAQVAANVTGHAKLPICGQLNFPTLPGGRRAEHVGRGEAEGDDSATDPERVGGGYGRAGAMGAGSSDVLRGAGDDR